MKIKSIIHGFLLGSSLFIIGPLVFAYLNKSLSLSILSFRSSAVIGLIIIILVVLAYIYCICLFVKDGKGTIVPSQPAQILIIKGPYLYTRNPIYMLHILYYLGLAFCYSYVLLFIYTIVSMPLYHLYVKYYEEPKLMRKFGTDYEKYLKDVPRWIL